MNARTTRAALALITAGGLAAGALLHPPTAEAYQYGKRVITVVSWTGSDCIYIHTPNVYDPYRVASGSQCDSGHVLIWDELARPGEWIGVDPDIYGLPISHVACSTTVAGELWFQSSASQGDGVEVTCLGILF